MYDFHATMDDGMRVYVDDKLLIDEWRDERVREVTKSLWMSAGNHALKVEYYDRRHQAQASLWWEPLRQYAGWRALYWANSDLLGNPVLVRDDASIDFYWDQGSPASGIPSDGFSARWTRTVRFEPGSYRFTVTSDDGARLWVNGHLLIDKWRDQPFWAFSGEMYVAGDVPIKMEYYENDGVAAARLTWTRVDDDTPAPPPGVVIVDDTGRGFVKGGSATGWRTAAEGYDGRLTWTRNNDQRRHNYNWARWFPGLAAGRYEVFVYIPERYTTTSNARYWVSHHGGFTLRQMNQSTNGSRWVSIGTYWFRGTRDDYVSLNDVTDEPYVSRLIAFDAVKWVPR